jgi:hypothetical protein
VIIAVVAMWVMEHAVIQVIIVIAVRYLLVPAILMATIARDRLALRGIGGTYGNGMLVIMPTVLRMHMSIV